MFVVVLLIILSLFLGLNVYLGSRILMWLQILHSGVDSLVFWVIYLLIAFSSVFSMALPHSKVSKGLKIFGSYWMGLFAYTFLTIVAVDILSLILKATHLLPDFFTTESGKALIGFIALIFVIGINLVGIQNARMLEFVTYDVHIDKKSDLKGVKIALVSDLHLGNIIGFKQMQKMVDKIRAIKPDLVLFAGDIFDGDYDAVGEVKEIAQLFESIESTYGSYAVLGNHDAGKTYPKMVSFFEDAGIRLLQDEWIVIDSKLTLLGRKDRGPIGEQGPKRKPIEDFISQVDLSIPLILMDHQPNGIEDARRIEGDLLVSGHTHQGQISPGKFITKKVFEVDYGLLKTGSLYTIVSSGAGTWGPPMRIASKCEVVEINIQFAP